MCMRMRSRTSIPADLLGAVNSETKVRCCSRRSVCITSSRIALYHQAARFVTALRCRDTIRYARLVVPSVPAVRCMLHMHYLRVVVL
jgi:hypothetical protein